MKLSHCCSHVRRDFIDLSKAGLTPIAAEVLRRIAEFYAIKATVRGRSPDERRLVRQERTKPRAKAAFNWLEEQLQHVPGRLKTAEVIRYVLNHREGLSVYPGSSTTDAWSWTLK